LEAACPAMVYIPRAWRHGKTMFIPANEKVNYTQAKTYCAISLLSFMQKTMPNSTPGTSGMKHWGMSPTSIKICLQIHRNRNEQCDYTYTGSSGKQEVTLELS